MRSPLFWGTFWSIGWYLPTFRDNLFGFRTGYHIFLFSLPETSRLGDESHPPLVHWVLEIKRSGRDPDSINLLPVAKQFVKFSVSSSGLLLRSAYGRLYFQNFYLLSTNASLRCCNPFRICTKNFSCTFYFPQK